LRYFGTDRGAALLLIVLLGVAWSPRPALAQIGTRPRPAVSYLRGPFVLLNIAVQFSHSENGRIVVTRVEHLAVQDRAAIARLVRLMNRDRRYSTIIPPCPGGYPGRTTVPTTEWLSFVRADGSKQHAVYSNSCSDYVIHGILLGDPGRMIGQAILTLIGGRG
jgi:hypothetical protein